MKPKILAITIICLAKLNAIAAYAQVNEITSPTDLTISGLIISILNLLGIVVLLALLAMLIYGGFVRITAAGDPEKEAQSTKILTAAVIGFLIIALSPLLINFLGQLLGLGVLIGL